MRSQKAAVAVVAALLVTHASGQLCPKNCNFRGVCSKDQTFRCECFDGYTGADCSLRTCPRGNIWHGYALATDDLHSQTAECSNSGECDRKTGICNCRVGFVGSACENLGCPGTPMCSGKGLCMTMRQAASGYDGYRLVRDPVAYTGWDADRIYGCVCDAGYSGADCSLRTCPSGDDPLTTSSQTPEVQTLSCSCSGTCSGAFSITYFGRSARVLHNAVATTAEEVGVKSSGAGPGESLQSVLATLREGPTFSSITFSDAAMCTPTGNDATITFVNAMGDATPLIVGTGTLASINGIVTLGVSTFADGTTENAPCSNRGVCDQTVNGTCTCLTGFGASDGNGNAGTQQDCGHVLVAPTACPLQCNFNGDCDLTTKTCACHYGYEGPACQYQTCPSGYAWFDEATGAQIAHAKAICSNAGLCDRSAGTCTCFPGFTGAACDRQLCPTDDITKLCSGHGQCLTNRDLTEVGLLGGKPRGQLEIQTITCTLASGSFYLLYNYQATAAINYDATPADLKAALQRLANVGALFVSGDSTVCTGGSGAVTRITFQTELYSPALLAVDPGSTADVTIAREQASTRVTYGANPDNTLTWDAEKIYGCHCDGYPDYNNTDATNGDNARWYGPACNMRTCARGREPRTQIVNSHLYALENQTILCTATIGSFSLSFRGATSAMMDVASTTHAVFRNVLANTDSIGIVTTTRNGVAVPATEKVCSGSNTAFEVNFRTEVGDLPLLEVGTSLLNIDLTISPLHDGLGTVEECSGRGICGE
jgi:hypothetical protein